MSNKQPPISANELVLDLLETHNAHELSVAALCRAAGVFLLTEQSVRVALSRLVRQGKVSKTGRGQYALNPAGSSLFRDVENWLRKEQRAVAWEGGWVGVFDGAVPRRNRVAWRRHCRALDLRGLRSLSSGLQLRPDNLAGGVASLRGDLEGLGLAPGAVVLGVDQLAAADEDAVRHLWDGAALRRDYREMLSWLERSGSRLEGMSQDQAAAETLMVGRAVIRGIIRDPLLPDALVSGEDRRELIARMRDYQDRAKVIWMRVLEGE